MSDDKYFGNYCYACGFDGKELATELATLRTRITALEAAGDGLTHPKHAYRYYCMWCGTLVVNIDHSPDCPVTKWKAIR